MTTAPTRTPAQEAIAFVDGTPEGSEQENSAQEDNAQENSAQQRLPLTALVVLAAMGFILVATETMPAGLLPVIAAGLHTGEGTVGLLVSAYALGTVIVTIPAIMLTRGMRRKPLLLGGIAGLMLATTVTAVSPDADVVTRLTILRRRVLGNHLGNARRLRPPHQPAPARRAVPGHRFHRGAPRIRVRHPTRRLDRNGFRLALVLRRALRPGASSSAALIIAFVPDAAGQPASVAASPGARCSGSPASPSSWPSSSPGCSPTAPSTPTSPPTSGPPSTGLSAEPRPADLRHRIRRRGRHHRSAAGPPPPAPPAPERHRVRRIRSHPADRTHIGTSAIVIAAALWGVTFGGASAQAPGHR